MRAIEGFGVKDEGTRPKRNLQLLQCRRESGAMSWHGNTSDREQERSSLAAKTTAWEAKVEWERKRELVLA